MHSPPFLSSCELVTKTCASLCFIYSYICVHCAVLQGQAPDLYSISGSAHFINKTDVGIVVHRPQLAEQQQNQQPGHGSHGTEPLPSGPPNVTIKIDKCRNKQAGRQGSAVLNYDRPTGRYFDADAARQGYTAFDQPADRIRRRNQMLGWNPAWQLEDSAPIEMSAFLGAGGGAYGDGSGGGSGDAYDDGTYALLEEGVEGAAQGGGGSGSGGGKQRRPPPKKDNHASRVADALSFAQEVVAPEVYKGDANGNEPGQNNYDDARTGGFGPGAVGGGGAPNEISKWQKDAQSDSTFKKYL